jgi:hypothetical protein
MNSVFWITTHCTPEIARKALAYADCRDRNYVLCRHPEVKNAISRLDKNFLILRCGSFGRISVMVKLVWTIWRLCVNRLILVDNSGIYKLRWFRAAMLNRRSAAWNFGRAYDPMSRKFEDEEKFWKLWYEPMFNRSGFRGPDVLRPKDKNEIRIFCLGGSTTYGSGYKENNFEIEAYETYPYKFGEKGRSYFSRFGIDITVFNLGIVGLSSKFLLERVKAFLSLKPDVATIHSGYNDLPILLDRTEEGFTFYQAKLEDAESFNWLIEQSRQFKLAAELKQIIIEHDDPNLIRDYYYLGHKLVEDINVKNGDESAVITEFHRRYAFYEMNIKTCIDFLVSHQVYVIFILQPYILPNNWVNRSSLRCPSSGQILRDLHKKQQNMISNTLLSAFNRNPYFCLLDLRTLFEKDHTNTHVDELHLTEYGNSIIADRLLEQLLCIKSLMWDVHLKKSQNALDYQKNGKVYQDFNSPVKRKKKSQNQSPFVYPLY